MLPCHGEIKLIKMFPHKLHWWIFNVMVCSLSTWSFWCKMWIFVSYVCERRRV